MLKKERMPGDLQNRKNNLDSGLEATTDWLAVKWEVREHKQSSVRIGGRMRE